MNYWNKLTSRHIASVIDVWEIPIPPLQGLCLYICLSSLPPSVSATVMLSPSLCVCRQEVTQCLTESRQRDKLISQQTHTHTHKRERGGGEGAPKTTQTKDRMLKLYSNTKQWGSWWIQSTLPFSHRPLQNPHMQTHGTSEFAGSAGAHRHTHMKNKDGGPDIWSIPTN